MKTLLVLGNGVDIHSGLNSSFKSFLEHRYEKIEALRNFRRNYKYDLAIHTEEKISETASNFRYILLHNKSISFWDLLLTMSDDDNDTWSDVERCLMTTLSNESFLKYLVANLNDQNHKINSNLPYLLGRFLSTRYPYRIEYKSIFDILKKELKIFEDAFNEYLLNQVENEKIQEVFKTKLTELVTNLGEGQKKIISFNYTDYRFLNDVHVDYVHGNIAHGTHDIIIGIDGSKMVFSDNRYSFSKTYRKFEHFIDSVVPIDSSLNDNFDSVYFYGHSLNEADYSYFQSIFDITNAYSGSTIYYFIYREYHNNDIDNENLRKKTINNVIKLLEQYKTTITNDNQKNNFIHKLLITKRVRIYEYSEYCHLYQKSIISTE